MCGATAAYRGRNTLILDHANKVGKKILMSGGGKCNFTNYFVEPDNYLSHNPHFCKSALKRYTQYDFIELVNRYNLAFHEKTQGQLFCDNKSQDILDILLSECDAAGTEIKTHCQITQIKQIDNRTNEQTSSTHFQLTTSQGIFQCESLVIATGGLSIPTMGATGFGFDIAKQFGLDVYPLEASLAPFTFSDKWLNISKSLSGVSVNVEITTSQKTFRDALLFTHRGISGPAVLQSSNYWQLGEKVIVNLLPSMNLTTILKEQRNQGMKTELKNLLSKQLPKNLVIEWLNLGIENKPVNQYSDAEIERISQHFHHWTFTPSGTEGYRTAEVTRGGVNTDEISSKTFEAKKVKGLYFIGEVLDVTGWLGGFNFQWAWSSGWCAGQYV